MPSNFKCDICFKAFNTNQHLSQHKNRKKKCTPCIDHNKNIVNTEFEMLKSTAELKKEPNNITFVIQEESTDTLTTNDTTSLLSNVVVSDNFGNTSVNIPNLLELVMNYKSILDEQIKYSKNIFALEQRVKYLEYENKYQNTIINKIKCLCNDMTENNDVQY